MKTQQCERCGGGCDNSLTDERENPYCRRCANDILGIPNPSPRSFQWFENIAVVVGLIFMIVFLPFWALYKTIRDTVIHSDK